MLIFFENIGLAILSFLEYVGGVSHLFFDSLSLLITGKIKIKITLDQMAILGVNSLPIVLLTVTFTGMVISLQIADFAVRYGVGNMVGGGVAIAMARELGPMLTAIVVAGRAGSAITAELGSMKVTEQIDAMEAMAASPAKYLVLPRLLALVLMLPLLTMLANVCGVIGGAIIAKTTASIHYKTFFDSLNMIVGMDDVYKGLFKTFFFAAEIAMISCYQGLTTTGGAAGVGKSTTASVVYATLLIFISNFILSDILF